MSKKIPVLVLAFNRADHVQQAMKAIAEYQPDRLYLECDGPRPYKEGEKEAVEETQKVMLDMVTWPCEVRTLFRTENYGCARGVNNAITWFFKQEEYGVIVEDDIVLSKDFFILCEHLLPRYVNETRIMEISAQNRNPNMNIANSYIYTKSFHCWGWATWRRAWEQMDMTLSAVPQMRISWMIRELGWFKGFMMYFNYQKAYKHIDKNNSWASRWFLSILKNDGYIICPGRNLAINIGMDGGAHYEKGDVNPYPHVKLCKMEWPIVYNDIIQKNTEQAKYDNREFLHVRYIGLMKKINKILK